MTDLQTVITTYWLYLLGAGLIGLLLGWLLASLGARGRAAQLEQGRLEAISRATALEQEVAGVRAENERLSAALQTAETSLAEAQARIGALQEELVRRDEALAALQQDLSETRAAAASAREALEASVQALTAEKLTLQTRLDNLLAERQTDLGEAVERAARLEQELEQRSQALVAAESELSRLQAVLAAATQQKADLETRLHQVRGQVAGEMAMVTAALLKMKDEALGQAQARIAQLQEALDSLQASG